MDIREEAINLHRKNKGKIEVVSKIPLNTKEDLSLVYTPGVAEPCKDIRDNPDLIYEYTNRGNMIAVVTDGSAVLGLGNIGSRAGMPVMEGKAILFKELGDVDAFPICLESQETEDIISAIKQIAPTFGGINLEDISAPKCFEVEKRLKEELDIPVFHDDQHGTAVVVLSAILNSLRVVEKDLENVKIVINGSGAAGIAIAKLLIKAGAKDIIICDRKGILDFDNELLEKSKREISAITNPRRIYGSLNEALTGSDIFIGVSAPKVLSVEDVKKMNKDSIILAMANPIPEIWPKDAKEGGARIIGTGRSDFPNQVNNVLVFPGIFKGALKVRAKDINEDMKIAAAYTIASLVPEGMLNEENILPDVLDKNVGIEVAKAVAKAAINSGISRI
jgi:malate dehydrogenase (oxaloacetate-decarboxylating)